MNNHAPVLISACLIGEPCRFDGQSKERQDLLQLLERRQLIPVCPEVAGGLEIPRPPAEIMGNQVLRKNGGDVTLEFKRGAVLCRDEGLKNGTELAILKSRSPACGCGQVYDGSFSGKLVEGDGVFTQTLKDTGIECISDEDYLTLSKK